MKTTMEVEIQDVMFEWERERENENGRFKLKVRVRKCAQPKSTS